MVKNMKKQVMLMLISLVVAMGLEKSQMLVAKCKSGTVGSLSELVVLQTNLLSNI